MSTASQRIVVITGGGGELGRTMVQAFSEQRAHPVLLDLRPHLQKAQTLSRKLSGDGIVLQCDVSSESEVRKAFQLIRSRWGRVDVLINNAGVPGRLITIAALTATGRQQGLELNIRMALNNGVTRVEVVETLLHLAPYVGFPAAWDALTLAGRVFAESHTDAVNTASARPRRQQGREG